MEAQSSELIRQFAELSKQYGSGSVDTDIKLALLAISLILLFFLAALIMLRKRDPETDLQFTPADAHSIKIPLNELKSQLTITQEQMRGNHGYVRQELAELREMMNRLSETVRS